MDEGKTTWDHIHQSNQMNNNNDNTNTNNIQDWYLIRIPSHKSSPKKERLFLQQDSQKQRCPAHENLPKSCCISICVMQNGKINR
jgi:hypothetical protein